MCPGNVTHVTHVTLAGFLKMGSVTSVTNVMRRWLETEEPNPPAPFPAGEGGDFLTSMRVGRTGLEDLTPRPPSLNGKGVTL